MPSATWLAVIGDVKSSRNLPGPLRAKLSSQIRGAMADVVRFAPTAFRIAPGSLKGDEIQAVLRPEAPGMRIVTYLRAVLRVRTDGAVSLRVGLGGGAVDRMSPKGPFESDGPAFHRARAALELVRKAGASRLSAWQTGDAGFDDLAGAMLGIMDSVVARWTLPQWAAVRERMEGKGLKRIAKQEAVSVQSVSKRLITASWSEFDAAAKYVDGRCARALGVKVDSTSGH